MDDANYSIGLTVQKYLCVVYIISAPLLKSTQWSKLQRGSPAALNLCNKFFFGLCEVVVDAYLLTVYLIRQGTR